MPGSTQHHNELARAQAALRASEAHFQRLFENVPVGVYESTPEGRILMANPALVEMLGFSSMEELQAANIGSDLYVQSRQRSEFLSRLEREGSLRNVELELRRKDGRPLIVLENCRMVTRDDGRGVVYEGMLVDITELRALEEQSRQAQKLQSIGQLAGGIAHDFNNLLTVINGYSELILSHFSQTDPLYASMAEIRKAGQRAATLTSQLLAFGRRQVMQPRVLDLNEVVEGAGPMIRRAVGDNIDLQVILSPVLDKIRADPAQLQQALLNLALNARDAMPGGGSLTLRTSNREIRGQGPGLPAGRYVELIVRDTGAGMNEEALSHVFEPFFTTKEVGQGTGLGLPSVYGIIRQSGGDIRVRSRVGEGTVFEILLPRVDAESEKPAVTAASTRGGKETVLIAEDQEDVRRLVIKILDVYGYNLLQAACGRDAIELADRYAGPIHLLVTEVLMPGMSGAELAGRLRESRPAMRVLCMSGYPDSPSGRPGGLPEGAVHLQKPFAPAVLAAKTRALLDQIGR